MAGVPGDGTAVDLNTIQKRIGRLKKYIRANDITKAKALATTLVSNLGAQNTLIQAATKVADLPTDPILPLRDGPSTTA